MSDPSASVRPATVVAVACAVWLAGVTPVPGAYTEKSPERKLELLEAGRRGWIVGHHLAAAGTAAVPVAYWRLAGTLPEGPARRWGQAAAAVLAAGAPLFVADLAVRASDLERFAQSRLPRWRFPAYAWLHVAGLAALAGALAATGRRRASAVVGATAFGSGAVLGATGDVVPAVFYLAELGTALSLRRTGAASGGASGPAPRMVR